ncbi:MAG: serpin family protein [Limisphaerales bacterium]
MIGFSTLAVLAQDSEKLTSANNDFAFKLLKQIAREQPHENIFISPFSVSTALQMVANGAAGETKTEIQNVLKTGSLSPDKLNTAAKNLINSLDSQPNVILNLANAIWYQNEFQLKPDFVAANKNFFHAKLAGVDFNKPKSADIINDWAGTKTHGKIKEIVSFPFSPAIRVILANAIYFKGRWAEPFDKGQTKSRPFYLSNNESKQTSMMMQHRHFSYQETKGFQAVRLAYSGKNLSMILFLPKTNSSPRQLLADLSAVSWQDDISSQFEGREGALVFPKFKLEYGVRLNNPLKALGIKKAFSTEADFSAMSDKPLHVSEAKQKSYIEVNEEGTEAAAVTGFGFTLLGAIHDPPKPFEMIVNHPFLFIIADEHTQSILFMGIVNDPIN